MKIHPEARKNVRNNIADQLRDIGNLEETKLAWDGKIPGVVRFYSEEVLEFFEDSLCGENLDFNVQLGLLSKEEAEILQPFYDLFKKFDSDHQYLDEYEHNFPNLPRWAEVSELASETYLKLGNKLRT